MLSHESNQSGFTLIELMIVVAIIAILAAISVSTYRFYVTRSQVTRVMGEVSQLRAAVEDCLNNGRNTIGIGTNQCDPGATGSNLLGGDEGNTAPGTSIALGTNVPALSALAGNADVTLTATFENNASTQIRDDTLTWTYNRAGGNWLCSTTVKEHLRPVGCGN